MVEPLPKPRPALAEPVDGTPLLYAYADVLDEIREKRELNDGLTEKLRAAADAFVKGFA